MNVSNCSGSTNAYPTSAPSGFRQQMQDFKGLANALQSGDISTAQNAMSTLQSDLQGAQTNGKTSPLLDETTPLGKDFKALQEALKSGDIKSAQDAFATLKKDVRSTRHAHGHHRHVDNDGDGDDGGSAAAATTPAPTSTDSSTEASPTLNVTA